MQLGLLLLLTCTRMCWNSFD